jgi:hypothetical protein
MDFWDGLCTAVLKLKEIKVLESYLLVEITDMLFLWMLMERLVCIMLWHLLFSLSSHVLI